MGGIRINLRATCSLFEIRAAHRFIKFPLIEFPKKSCVAAAPPSMKTGETGRQKRGSERTGVNLMPESLLFQRCTPVSGRTILYCRKSTKTKLVDFQTPTADLRASVIGGLYALKGDHLIEVLYARCWAQYLDHFLSHDDYRRALL